MITNERSQENLHIDYENLTKDDAYHIIKEKDRKLTKYKFQYLQTKELYEEILAFKNSKDIVKLSVNSLNEFFGKLIEEIKIDLKKLGIPRISYDFCVNNYQTLYEDFIINESKFSSNKLEINLKSENKSNLFKEDYIKLSTKFTPRNNESDTEEKSNKLNKSEGVQNNYVYNYNNNLNQYHYNFPNFSIDCNNTKDPSKFDEIISKSVSK